MIYPIVIYGNEVLRKQCEEIAPDYPEVKKLVEDMFLTLGEAEGVGLAAPQIGRPDEVQAARNPILRWTRA